jgi:hypothetical protein
MIKQKAPAKQPIERAPAIIGKHGAPPALAEAGKGPQLGEPKNDFEREAKIAAWKKGSDTRTLEGVVNALRLGKELGVDLRLEMIRRNWHRLYLRIRETPEGYNGLMRQAGLNPYAYKARIIGVETEQDAKDADEIRGIRRKERVDAARIEAAAELREMASDGDKKMHMSPSEIKNGNWPLWYKIGLVGGYDKAMRMAGLNPKDYHKRRGLDKVVVDETKVEEYLKMSDAELAGLVCKGHLVEGRFPSKTELEGANPELYAEIVKRFGRYSTFFFQMRWIGVIREGADYVGCTLTTKNLESFTMRKYDLTASGVWKARGISR